MDAPAANGGGAPGAGDAGADGAGADIAPPRQAVPPGHGPRLFMHDPTSAADLSEASGLWIIGGESDENLADASVTHCDMAAAPPAARRTAEHMHNALGNATLPASESDTTGHVVVIVGVGDKGLPNKAGLLAALGLKTQVDGVALLDEAILTPKNYLQHAACGFCYSEEDEDDDDEDEDRRRVRATTAIMVAELRDHFELNFSEDIVAAPVLYGGRASDGNVVAVLSMRVWT
jgi:hypothetical protein